MLKLAYFIFENLCMKEIIEKAIQLKQVLVDFVYDAEDDLAVGLEKYAAEKGKKNSYGIKQQDLTINLFITNGEVNGKTPLDIFLDAAKDLNSQEKEIIGQWKSSFVGLFEIQSIEDNYYKLMNWLTAKTYKVYGHSRISAKEVQRWQPGEIILSIIAPINIKASENNWFFFSDRIIKGKLSQPKLAVAVGEFRDNYPDFLYADAPELLEQAWNSVAVYHDEFVSYFGSDRLTLPGYKLNQKIADLQQKMSDKKLKDAGIDSNKSLSEMLDESGTSKSEFAETANDLGIDTETVEKITNQGNKLSMVTPKVDLPPEIKQADSVTVFSHPKWGQIFLPDFVQLTDLLSNNLSETEAEISSKVIQKYLEKPEVNYYIWQQLKQEYPENLEALLRDYSQSDRFDLDNDLDDLLLQYNKNPTPELPTIASVPLHLNNLFETAVAQVQKSKSKTKKRKKKKGFLS